MGERIRLKNDQYVDDPRLGWISEHDEKSRGYSIRPLVTGLTPRSYSWACGVTLDQGQTSECVGFSIAQEGAARPVIEPTASAVTAHEIYHRAQDLDQWPGHAYDGTSVLAGMKAAAERGWYPQYRWSFSVADLVVALGYRGPAVLGVTWYDAMFDPDKRGYVHATGSVAGGHAILANGVDVTNKRIKLHNSWGPTWGGNVSTLKPGEAWISYADVEKILADDGETAIPMRRAIGR